MAGKTSTRRYWLLKSDAESFSFDDLERAPDGRTGWDGVRNYTARNLLRDELKAGDGVLFYHSSAEPSGVAGVARVTRGAHTDPTQFDPADEHFDPKSDRAAPRWVQVEVAAVRKLPRFVPLAELRASKPLAAMALLRPGQRLSVLPLTAAEWREVLRLGGLRADPL